jgi:NTE family protein
VLGGGGARGFAHLGVLRALQEQGIDIDCVGGTSIGAVMAWPVAVDQPVAQLMPVVARGFGSNPTGDYNLIPFVSLASGRRVRSVMRRGLQELLGAGGDAVGIEDLWKTFFCVASNYSQAREEVLRSGPLLAATLASLAIPGALPPVVHDGDLLCDGGTFNNYPVDVMRAQRGIGCVIGVDLSARKARRIEVKEVPGTWALLRDRLRPRAARRYKLPSLPAILLNATILYSESRLASAARLTDVHFKPPLERVGLLHWHRLKDIERQGYDYAKQLLAQPEVAAKLARP